MKLIGQGLFSKVYKIGETQVLIKSTCLVKECIANFIEYDINLPRLERTDNLYEYICEYYPKVTSLKNTLTPECWKVYKELKYIQNYSSTLGPDLDILDYIDLFNEYLSNEEYKESIINLLHNLMNYGRDIVFEITPRNVAVKDGRLILLDIFFFRSQAKIIWNSKIKKSCY